MKHLFTTLGALALLSGTPLAAQNIPPFDINEDRIRESGSGRLGDSKTYFIPTYYVLLSVHGSVWAQAGGAQAKGRFFVDGLTKSFVQDLSKKAYDDLVTKLRGAGFTVVTFDDLKNDPAITERDKMKPDDTWTLPTKKAPSGHTFVVGTPTDDMALGYGLTGPGWSHRGAAKDKDFVVLIPELWMTTPFMRAKTEKGYVDKASIEVEPSMKLYSFNLYGINPKQAGFYIIVQEHGMRLASEKVGTIEKLSETKTDFSSEWKRTSGDFSLAVDQAAFATAVLRVAYASNDLTVERAKKAQK